MTGAAQDSPFRVIVVGAGITGLLASHVFQKLGIDHVVLEKRQSVAPPEGASIGIYPHGARLLHQLGCLEALAEACAPPGKWIIRRPDGKVIIDSAFFQNLEKNHGTGMFLLERRKYLQILFDCLPDKSPIRTGCAVTNIQHTATGVEVTLSNGEIEVGDVVIGCDGAYSSVRNFMWQHAALTEPGLITAEEKRTIKTHYKGLIGMTPRPPDTAENDLLTNHGNKRSFLGLLTPKHMFYAFFFRLDEPMVWPRRAQFTDQDAEVLAESVADYPVSDTLLFGELWKDRVRGFLVPLEEGVLDHWYHGRIVLAGDASMKITPNMGLGGNSGMESIAVLCNHLHRVLKQTPAGTKPGIEALTQAFSGYQAERLARARQVLALSGLVLRMQSGAAPWYKAMGNLVLPMIPDQTIAGQFGKFLHQAPKFEFLDSSGFPRGARPWKDEEDAHLKGEAKNSDQSPLLWVSAMGLVAATAAFMLC
ncbi:hypothetical protein J7T55_010996 [Diaporthe amygdali]|uniref:uncharacterized protein n=1 Tax=Phomopsis amygdali TaxID=1214568 RepID=UPI0022FE5B55|nr:uncharacterized protein J7T55_010996 [Diaporthe amygdali]KAJ0103979.1 hypothetical protein J7T55_010996 [Diaporthe amygdali]